MADLELRKIGFAALLGGLLLALTACGGAEETATEDPVDTPTTDEVTDTGDVDANAVDLDADVADEPETDWVVDYDASSLTFTFESFGGDHEGRFGSWHALIVGGPENLDEAYAEVTVDLDSIDTNQGDRDATAKGRAYLHVSEYPQATFSTTAFRRISDNQFEAEAELTIKGESEAITLPFILEQEGDAIVVTGDVTFPREAFNVGDDNYEEAGPEITVHVDLKATRRFID